MRTLLPLLLVPTLSAATPTPAPFAARLDGALAAQKGNLVYSPTSITLAMMMARAGASGETAAQLDRVFGSSAAADSKKFLAALPKDSKGIEPVISIANRLYGDFTMPFEQAFLDATRSEYGAEAEPVDFKHHAEDSRAEINKWVSGQTHDKIRELLGEGTVTKETKAVLVNAIYLQAQWQTGFPVANTKADPFAIDGVGPKNVPTMHTVAGANLGDHDGARLLDLPYFAGKGPRLSMLIVVPENRTLPMIEADYAREGFAPFEAAASKFERVAVSLPKFETGTSVELGKTFRAFGMTDAFDKEKADFSAMSKTRTLISAVVHEAWIKVDETGTEAAAATGVGMIGATAMPAPPLPFAVDRSFLFFVHDDQGNVLFAGRILDPSK